MLYPQEVFLTRSFIQDDYQANWLDLHLRKPINGPETDLKWKILEKAFQWKYDFHGK